MIEGLVCPQCLGFLRENFKRLICSKCRKAYLLRNGIYVMWRPEFNQKTFLKFKGDLNFTQKYVEAIKKKNLKFLKENTEFFEREQEKSLAAKMVDKKAAQNLFDLTKAKFKGFRILDIGAGGGKEAKWLLKNKAKEVCCLDISFPFLKLAQERLKNKRVSFVVANAEKLPFENNSFDLAVFMGALHHLSDTNRVLKEAVRVSRRIAIIDEPASMSFLQKFLNLIRWNTEYGRLPFKRFDPENICQILQKQGMNASFKTDFIWFPFPWLGRLKNQKTFLNFYFACLSFLDKYFGSLGHNLTVYAEKY